MSLTGKLIKDSYKDLLVVDNSNAGVDGTMRSISDGEGTTSALQISETGVQVNGDLNITGTTNIEGETFNYRGEWDESTLYSKNDVISRSIDSYVAKQNSPIDTLPSLDQDLANSYKWQESKNGKYVARSYLVGTDRMVEVIQTSDIPYSGSITYSANASHSGMTLEDVLSSQDATALLGAHQNANQPHEFLRLDYGENLKFTGASLGSFFWKNTGQGTAVANLEVSDNGTDWEVVDTYSLVSSPNSFETNIEFTGRYLRIYIVSSTSEGSPQINKIVGNAIESLDLSLGSKVGNVISSADTQSASGIHEFGVELAISDEGTTLVVSSKNDYYYIYELENNAWVLKVTRSISSSNNRILVDVSEDGTKVIAGAFTASFNNGIVEVYTLSGGTWSFVTDFEGGGYDYNGYNVRAFNEFFIYTAHGYLTFQGSIYIRNWAGALLTQIEGSSSNIRLGVKLVADYASDGKLNIFTSDNNSNWYWYKYDPANQNTPAVLIDGGLGIYHSSDYANGFYYKLDGTDLTIFQEDVVNNTLEQIYLETEVDQILFINSYEGVDYLYLIKNGNIQSYTQIKLPAPEDDPTTWQTIAKGVTFNLAGVYTPETGGSVGYKKFDIVSHNGSSYIARNDVVYSGTILAPDTDPTNWQLFAQ